MEEIYQNSLETYKHFELEFDALVRRIEAQEDVPNSELIKIAETLRKIGPEICVSNHRQCLGLMAQMLFRFGGYDPKIVPEINIESEKPKYRVVRLSELVSE